MKRVIDVISHFSGTARRHRHCASLDVGHVCRTLTMITGMYRVYNSNVSELPIAISSPHAFLSCSLFYYLHIFLDFTFVVSTSVRRRPSCIALSEMYRPFSVGPKYKWLVAPAVRLLSAALSSCTEHIAGGFACRGRRSERAIYLTIHRSLNQIGFAIGERKGPNAA